MTENGGFMGNFIKAALTKDIQDGSGITVELEGKSIAVFNSNGKFYAIDNTCKHRGGPLGEGSLDGNVVTCPWHGWQFDITNGNCVTNPAGKINGYALKIERENILIEI